MPNWVTPLTDLAAGNTLTAAHMDDLRNSLQGANPIGHIIYVVRAGTSIETLVNGAWLECMPGTTSVALPDGDTIPLGRLVQSRERREVVARSSDGEIVAARVNGWQARPARPGEWRRLTAGGASFYATVNHPVATQRGWTRVRDLRPGDRAIRLQETLTYVGRQALMGVLLGDGSLSRTGRFATTHGVKQRDYLSFVAGKLGVPVETQGVCLLARRALRRLDLEMSEMTRGRAAAALDPIGLAFWYSDDGHLCRDSRYPDYERAQFHTEGLSVEVVDALVARLGLFGLRATKYGPYRYRARTFGSGLLLRLDRESSERFFRLVAGYVEPSMRYKLPARYRHVPFALAREPFLAQGFAMHNVSVARRLPSDPDVKYDISVGDAHCFVGDGALVHNCNGVAVSRTTYADLNSLMSSLSYPFGNGNGTTTFNVPDLRGRTLVAMAASGHADVNGLGDSDGLALGSRTPKDGISISGTSGAGGSHTHTLASGTVTPPSTYSDTSYNGADPSITSQRGGSFTLGGSTGAESAHTHSFSGSDTVAGNYLVAGVHLIKAFL